jgi:hypothetical protein
MEMKKVDEQQQQWPEVLPEALFVFRSPVAAFVRSSQKFLINVISNLCPIFKKHSVVLKLKMPL